MKTTPAMFTSVALTLVLAINAPTAVYANDEVHDPFEQFNRRVQRFNDAGDEYVIGPAARAYRKVTPSFFRAGVRNFLSNISYPVTIVNQFLQGKVKLGFQDTARFVVNTTLGFGGILDIASREGLPAHNEDFGQTFAKWGMPRGPYIVFPIWGGVSLREGIGDIPDTLFYPPTHIAEQSEQLALSTLWALSRRDELRGAEQLVSGDRYEFIRDAYLQQRDFQIADGEVEDPFLD